MATATSATATTAGLTAAVGATKTRRFSIPKFKVPWKLVRLWFFRVTKFTASLILGAVIFFFLGELAPALREHMPNFYQIIDAIIGTFNEMCNVILHPPFIG